MELIIFAALRKASTDSLARHRLLIGKIERIASLSTASVLAKSVTATGPDSSKDVQSLALEILDKVK